MIEQLRPTSPPSSPELLDLSKHYMDKTEKYVEMLTKAIKETEEARSSFQKLQGSWLNRGALILKAFAPYAVTIILLIGLHFLPPGISWEGFGQKLTTSVATCVMKQ